MLYQITGGLASTCDRGYGLGVEPVARHELEATVAARQELGPGHDDELIAGFLDRIEREIDRRVDERVAMRGPAKRRLLPAASRRRSASASRSSPSRAGSAALAGLIVAFIALGIVFAIAEFRR